MDAPRPSADARIMASLSHISIILPFWGTLAAIVIWVTQKDKSPFVKFQALQSIIYQVALTLAGIIGMGCYMFSFFGMFALVPFLGGESSAEQQPDPAGAAFAFLFFIVPMGIMAAMFGGWILANIYGLLAAISTFQGKDFKYLLIGRWVERQLADQAEASASPAIN